MNQTHLHLLLNHAAIFASIYALPVLLFGMYKKKQGIINVALAGMVEALIAIPVFLTGEPAEESVEALAGVTKQSIETHEESAQVALWLIEIAGGLALLKLLFRNTKFLVTPLFTWVIVLSSAAATGSIAYTGFVGGKIRHSAEINATAQSSEQESATTGEDNEGED